MSPPAWQTSCSRRASISGPMPSASKWPVAARTFGLRSIARQVHRRSRARTYNDFEIVAANLLDRDPRRLSDRIPAYALYTDPPLGRAGMTEREVRQRNKPALIAKRPMTRVGRAVEKGETRGFMKVLVDAEDRRILGAALLGTGGDEVVHSLLDLMYAGAPYTVLQRAMHIHPTVSELLPTMLDELEPLELAAAA